MAADEERWVLTEMVPRIDAWLAGQASVGSRRRAREALESGKVAVDGRTLTGAEAGLPVPAGAEVVLSWSRPGTGLRGVRASKGMADVGLRVLYEDPTLIAVDKPAGLLTVAADQKQRAQRDTVQKRLDALLAPRNQKALACHRIDGDTSGVVLFAKDPRVHARVRELFSDHVPERVYLCIVDGHPDGEEGTWEDWMRWDQRRLRQLVARPNAGGAVLASAHWKVAERFPRGAMLEVRLHTGRRNQIRLHLGTRGMPLVGERIYLPERSSEPHLDWARQGLHAWKLSLPHPEGGDLSVESPLPPDLQALVSALRRGKGTTAPSRR